MNRKTRALFVPLLCLSLCAGLISCAAPPPEASPSPSEEHSASPPPEVEWLDMSYDNRLVAFPRMWLHVQKNEHTLYVSIPRELADECVDILNNAADQDTSHEATGQGGLFLSCDIFNGENENVPNKYISVWKSKDGRFGISGRVDGSLETVSVEAPETVEKLIAIAEEATGWDFDADIRDFYNLSKVEVVLGDEVIHTVTDAAQLAEVEALFQRLDPRVAPKTPDYCLELRCVMKDGTAASVVGSVINKMIFLPPAYHFTFYGDPNGLLNALGLESWPEPVLNPEEYPYPDGFFDSMYERLGAAPPIE